MVVLGGVLAGVASSMSMYEFVHEMNGTKSAITMSLFGVVLDEPEAVHRGTLISNAWPVLGFAVLMVVAAVFTLKGRWAARVWLLGAAGALAGVAFAILAGAVQDAERVDAMSAEGINMTTTYLPGMYLLIAAAVVGMVGAVLAQRVPLVRAVVVEDVDTPPFGIEVLKVEEAR